MQRVIEVLFISIFFIVFFLLSDRSLDGVVRIGKSDFVRGDNDAEHIRLSFFGSRRKGFRV